MLKRLIISTVLVAILGGLFAGCSKEEQTKPVTASGAQSDKTTKQEITLKVGSAAVPHAEILDFIKPKLKEEGINLEVIVLSDEAQLNPSLKDKQIDANFFQHVPYLESVSKEKGYEFTVAGKVHVEPIGFYSQKLQSKDQLKEGSKIAIPDNPSNEYRALVLLQANGLIKLKDDLNDYSATPLDIVENPKKLDFVEVEAPQLVRALPDVDGAVINTNYVLEAKLDPKSAIFREDANSPYANVIVVRQGEETRPEIKKLIEILNSEDLKKFILDKYEGFVVPAF